MLRSSLCVMVHIGPISFSTSSSFCSSFMSLLCVCVCAKHSVFLHLNYYLPFFNCCSFYIKRTYSLFNIAWRGMPPFGILWFNHSKNLCDFSIKYELSWMCTCDVCVFEFVRMCACFAFISPVMMKSVYMHNHESCKKYIVFSVFLFTLAQITYNTIHKQPI